MSITPTEYDLQQDGEIQDLREIVTTDYQEVEGEEQSFPVVDEPMDDDQWAHLAKAFGSGVISYGGAPYRLGEVDDVNNTLTVLKADDEGRESGAIIEGFAHRMTGDVELSIPAVTSTTDYVIGLQYNPVRAKEEGEPITLGCFTRPLDTTQGKKYAPIWEGTRRPSTVLSSVRWNTARSRISPTTTVSREQYLPDPRHSGLMWGTICYTYRDKRWFQLQWATEDGGEMVWVEIGFSSWEPESYGSTYKYPGHGAVKAMAKEGDRRHLRGRWAIANDTSFVAPSSSGYLLWSLAEEDRPTSEVRRVVVGHNLADPKWGVVNISSSTGEVRFHPAQNTTWVDIGEISYSVA